MLFADEKPEDATDAPIDIVPPDSYEFISRADYDALPRRGVLEALELPVKYVIIAHTEGANCTDLVRKHRSLSHKKSHIFIIDFF